MKEYKSHESLPKINNKIVIGENVMVGGYMYTKKDEYTYENNSTIIKVGLDDFGNVEPSYSNLIFKQGVKKAGVYNQFGQRLKSY